MFSTLNFRALRMLDWLVIAVVLALAVWLLSPHQLPTSLYKLSLIASAAVAGYWVDRSLFPYARPDSFLVLDHAPGELEDNTEDGPYGCEGEVCLAPNQPMLQIMGVAMLRRAIIVAAAMIAVGLGA
ncbi:MAG: putative holin [Burkholderiaceae bacterium]|nr:putative holin [Burkholderiaceae bacterium]